MKNKQETHSMYNSFEMGLHENDIQAAPKPIRHQCTPDEKVKPEPSKAVKIKSEEEY